MWDLRAEDAGCDICAGAYYRCTARTMAPGSALLRDHPKTVNLREEPVVEALNGWIGQLFNRTNINATVAALLDSQAGQRISGGRDVAERRLLDAESRIRRFQDAIAAGVDPAALVDPLNRAQAECAAAQAEIDNAPASTTLTDAEVYVMIDSLGDVGAALRNTDPIRLHQLYRRLDLSVRFEPIEQAVYVIARPRVDTSTRNRPRVWACGDSSSRPGVVDLCVRVDQPARAAILTRLWARTPWPVQIRAPAR